jgi:hypothetical protein
MLYYIYKIIKKLSTDDSTEYVFCLSIFIYYEFSITIIYI